MSQLVFSRTSGDGEVSTSGHGDACRDEIFGTEHSRHLAPMLPHFPLVEIGKPVLPLLISNILSRRGRYKILTVKTWTLVSYVRRLA